MCSRFIAQPQWLSTFAILFHLFPHLKFNFFFPQDGFLKIYPKRKSCQLHPILPVAQFPPQPDCYVIDR